MSSLFPQFPLYILLFAFGSVFLSPAMHKVRIKVLVHVGTRDYKRLLLEAFVVPLWRHDGGEEQLKIADGFLHSHIEWAQ